MNYKKLFLWMFKKYRKESDKNRPQSPPKSTKPIGYFPLKQMIREKFPGVTIYFSDIDYLLCGKEDIQRFLKADETDRYTYVKAHYDCDDFAYRLMGQFSVPRWSHLAFGIVWTTNHAMNCFVDEDKVFWFIEPQNDKLYREIPKGFGSAVRIIIM